eukprot:CAMPEP_0197451548 /NCGR_PEP_ID=MMETSP1175-20131217/29337_1 /TAXON_ID=1003142 /ORGANISM="Triceratium dubium, Strain CCMP147" /LENGTH=52 /DNA_ID=CAMNT_0042984303 /DNA_START=17 /DNA_END=175 /DNA_ORIENTATION=-
MTMTTTMAKYRRQATEALLCLLYADGVFVPSDVTSMGNDSSPVSYVNSRKAN